MTKKITLVLIASIMVLATVLRVWQLNTQMIFFGDAAHDLLVARQALIDRQLPLLGIESSVPRFRQGPVAIWIIMLSQLIVGLTNTYGIALVFAGLSIGALIGLYELMAVFTKQKTAIISLALLAVSPIAVAHGRVPYHITPIPLAIVGFLWAVHRLWHNKKWALPLALFSWAVAFQFELALLPLIAVPSYILWKKKRKPSLRQMLQSVAALGAGLLPQIVYDLTHGFQHLGGFSIWVIYRIAAFGGYKDAHTFSWERLGKTATIFWFYFKRIVSVDQNWLALIFLGLLIGSFIFIWKQYKQKKVPPLIEITTVSFLLLSGAYIIHGSPSEAYFPPFLVLIPILIGYLLGEVTQKWQPVLMIGLTIYLTFTSWSIWNANFFVSTTHHFNYGASIQEQRQVMNYLVKESDNAFTLKTTNPAGEFANYFDNLHWVHLESGHPAITEHSHLFYIESEPTLDTYPLIKKVPFTTVIVYQLL